MISKKLIVYCVLLFVVSSCVAQQKDNDKIDENVKVMNTDTIYQKNDTLTQCITEFNRLQLEQHLLLKILKEKLKAKKQD